MNILRVLILGAMLALAGSWALAADAPQLRIPDEPPGAPGTGVPANLLLNFSVTHEDAGAAYRDAYRAEQEYAGYFNARLCYQYPMKATAGSGPVPDLDERNGYFSPAGPADARHECRGAFSGNFLNWASTSTLDLLRYALTGGDRVIDEPALTVLQRAWLPDGVAHADFYAHPDHFPRKAASGGAGGSSPAHVTPFATDILYIVSCRNRILFSNSNRGTSCDAPRFTPGGGPLTSDKYFGEFNARVMVCSAEDSALRADLCIRYDKAFKPQGVMHRGAQRLGVMGYLTGKRAEGTVQDGAAQESGVLRAPLKQLGPLEQPEESPNAGREWHPGTGVIADNPDRASDGVSGAIHYINRLGRSNPARLGAYAGSDPGAELYYEALRYLQGRESGIASGSDLDDGMPVWRRRDDPVLSGCQRNIIATIGHASFTDDRFVPGNTGTGRGDAARAADSFAPSARFDVMRESRRVGELEAASGAPGRGDLLRLDTLGDGPQGRGSYYLAGAAYWAHSHAIRGDKPVRVDSLSLELGTASRPPEGVLYYAAKYGAFDDRNKDADPGITVNGVRNTSEWSTDGVTPSGYFAARDSNAIVGAVRALFARAGGQGGLGSGPAVAGLSHGERFLIQAGYHAGGWHGTLKRRSLRIAEDGTAEIGANTVWDANLLLSGDGKAQPAMAPSERKLFTLAYDTSGAARTIEFRWPALPAGLRALLDLPAPGGTADGLGEMRLEYLRGVRALEEEASGTPLRRRTGVLGDIIRSTPLLVRHKSGRSVVYAGANDGMLHAFDASDGKELFGYFPHTLIPALSQLASSGYRHRPYVDGSPGHGEARIHGRWHTVLASGMGMGARGVFALDITDPPAFATGMGALWEFTERDDPAIGYIHAPPLIAKLKTSARNGVPQYRYMVIVSSGINPLSSSGGGALFMLALDKTPSEKWQRGVNYYKFATPAAGSKTPNALAPAVLAIAADGSARYAYAGDLQGSLWRFDLSGLPPWGKSLTTPLFVARDQAIAHAPALVFAPGGGYLVTFATGKFLEARDANVESFRPQSFYAIHDQLVDPIKTLTRGALEIRTLTGKDAYRIGGQAFTYGGDESRQGWFFDFPNTANDGERAAGSPAVRAGALLFDTLVFGSGDCGGPSRRSYLVDALTGLALGSAGLVDNHAVTAHLMPADAADAGLAATGPLLFGSSASLGPRNATGGTLATRTFTLVRLSGKSGPTKGQQIKIAYPAGRLSWREVANWQDIHKASKR